jgi:hypothetical protein
MDGVKGDPVNSLPGNYPIRNREVRVSFDRLEREFEVEVPEVMRKAVEADKNAAAGLLDEFSERCVKKVIATIRELLEAWV